VLIVKTTERNGMRARVDGSAIIKERALVVKRESTSSKNVYAYSQGDGRGSVSVHVVKRK
jgi:hypothetical protein